MDETNHKGNAMTQARISYNADGKFLDPNSFRPHLKQLNPSWVLVMDALGLAADVARDLPACNVIHRDYAGYKGDDDLSRKISPENWIDGQLALGNLNIWRYCHNEPGFNADTISWFVRVIRYNLTKATPLKLVVGNFAVGNPGADNWNQAKELLELCSQHRDITVLGLHEYFAAVPTSGFYGGYPNNAGVAPGSAGGQNLTIAWSSDTSKITLFHCGRFRFLLNYCKSIGLTPPRIVITEQGADDVSDIKPFLEGLVKTPPYTSIRGYKTLFEQWRLWYPQWTPERAYFEMLAYLDRAVYQGSPVEAQLVFTWSDTPDQNWQSFNVAHALEFQGWMLSQNVITPPVTPQYPPFPSDFDERALMGDFRITASPALNVRSNPTQLSALVGSLPQGIVNDVEYILADRLRDSERYENNFGGIVGVWIPVRFIDAKSRVVEGWTFSGYMALETKSPPVETKHTVTIRIGGLTREQAQNLVHNVIVQIEEET